MVVASFRPTSLLEATVAALVPQCERRGAELIVARAADDVDELRDRFPSVRFEALAPGTPLPVVRGTGLARAHGDPVALTEDHCVPAPDWVDCLAAARSAGADVVGGGMAHAPSGRVADWGAYFSEYGFFSHARPRTNEPLPLMTGANVAYGRAVVSDVAEWMSDGAWENVVHDRLAGQGRRLVFEPGARVIHNHSYRFAAFCSDRYAHGHGYARDRLAERGSNRWVRLAITPALPLLLFGRVARAAAAESLGHFLAAAPITLAFLTSWAAGEAVGYLRPGSPTNS